MKLWIGVGAVVAVLGYFFEWACYKIWCWFWRKAEELD